MIPKENIEKYKKILEIEKMRLLEAIKRESRPTDFGSDVDHSDEESDESEEFQNQLSIAQTLKERVNEIDASLNKIHLGTYGQCENCGREISTKVLEAAPESCLCQNCKKSSSDE